VRLLIVEQQADAPAGLVEEWARARGAEVEVVRATEIEAWPEVRAADAVVALGSEASVHATKEPWVAAEVDFLRRVHAADVPLLGICFGGQALSAALGGTVRAAPETEIGWVDIEGDDGYGGCWFTWHEDVFTLPPGAEELARAPSGPQAFAAGRSVGLQYHPEVTPTIVAGWLASDDGEVASPGEVRDETARRAEDARRRAFGLFDRVLAR
jgi:GMP synthase-like glutamine amidotransferase